MSKSTITKLFVAAAAAVVVGVVIGTVAVVIGLVNGAIVIGGSQIVTVNGGPFASALAGLIVASLIVGAGTVAAIAAWVGALLDTSRLEDKSWFVALLVLGIVSLGWVAMIAYVYAGPEAPRKASGQDQVAPIAG